MRALKKWAADIDSGQVLIGVLLLLLLMAIMVPGMVFLTQREARWAEKQAQSTIAFHLAEVGIEKGYRAISLSTATWYDLTDNGAQLDDFYYDTVFSDIPGGEYIVSVTSGPEARQATILSIGRVVKGGRYFFRGVKTVFAQFSEEVAVSANSGVDIGGGINVHWGAVISKQTITTGGRTSPQFKSAGSIMLNDATPIDDDPAVSNCGPNGPPETCCQWWSYDQDLPEALIAPDLYKVPAQTDDCSNNPYPAHPSYPGSCYYQGNQNWATNPGFATTGGSKTVYVNGNLNLPNGKKLNIAGDLIVRGNLDLGGGAWGDGDIVMIMPRIAWKQYCQNWAYYRTTFDGAAPVGWPGLSSSYKSAPGLTYHPTPANKTAVQGLLYVEGNLNSSGGGGNTRIYGNLYVMGTITLTAGTVDLFYNLEAAQKVKTLRLNLKRVQWEGHLWDWDNLKTNWPPF